MESRPYGPGWGLHQGRPWLGLRASPKDSHRAGSPGDHISAPLGDFSLSNKYRKEHSTMPWLSAAGWLSQRQSWVLGE